MRTTVEITDEQRAQLLRIAGSRGEKGFSGIVRDAIDHYLRDQAEHRDRVAGALAVRGALSGRAADDLQERVHAIRGTWR